jgi:hypothetical protein
MGRRPDPDSLHAAFAGLPPSIDDSDVRLPANISGVPRTLDA